MNVTKSTPTVKTQTPGQRIVADLRARRRIYEYPQPDGTTATITQFAAGPRPFLVHYIHPLGFVESRHETLHTAQAAVRRYARRFRREVA